MEKQKMWVALLIDVDSRIGDEPLGAWPTKDDAVNGGRRIALDSGDYSLADEDELWWIEPNEVEVFGPEAAGAVEQRA